MCFFRVSGVLASAFNHGGVPRTVVPAQLRAGVIELDRYESHLQRTYDYLGLHYSTAPDPADLATR